MKKINIELNERDLDVLKKDQQVWKEIDGQVFIIRELLEREK